MCKADSALEAWEVAYFATASDSVGRGAGTDQAQRTDRWDLLGRACRFARRTLVLQDDISLGYKAMHPMQGWDNLPSCVICSEYGVGK